MFRKPKRKAKATLRRRDDEQEDGPQKGTDSTAKEETAEEDTSELLDEARKRLRGETGQRGTKVTSSDSSKTEVMHSYASQKERVSASDLVTSTADHHPDAFKKEAGKEEPDDGIFRDTKRNPMHAGPIRAAAHVRVTARFDYQPDICKDYKETGFCGFGDTCIYLHDRGDTLTGWQLEQQWEEQQRKKKEQQEKEMLSFAEGKTAGEDGKEKAEDDGLPFACHVCRGHFTNPVVTNCGHYFCEKCVMDHVRTATEACPICGKDTGSVFNQPTKLIAKKRRVLGAAKAKADNSWQLYAEAFSKTES
jgi:RING finger protein 113A